jgi:hypothetical protein
MSEPSIKQRLRRARERAARRLEKGGWEVYVDLNRPYLLLAKKGMQTKTIRVDNYNSVK